MAENIGTVIGGATKYDSETRNSDRKSRNNNGSLEIVTESLGSLGIVTEV